MALALCLTLLPAPAWAAEADAPEGGAAQIGETVYSTLPEAVTAAQDGDTIKLLADYKTAEGAGDEEESGLTITKSVTLNLNGHGMDDFRVVQVNDAAETLPSGNLTVEDTSAGKTGKVTGTIELLAGKLTINGGAIGDGRDGVSIENGNLIVNGGAIDYLYGSNSGTVTINGGTVKNARFSEGFNITVTGGSGHTGLWDVSEGTWNISGGAFEGVIFLTASPAKNATISGGTFRKITRKILRDNTEALAPISGLLADGYAFYQKTDSGEYDQCVKLTDATAYLENVQVKGHTHNFVNGVCTVCDYACLHTNMNGDGFCPDCQTQMAVKITASDNTVTYGTDFKAALDNAANGTKITLLANAAVGTVALEGKTVTLDLNGKTVENSSRGSTPIQIGSSNSPASLVITGRGSFISVDQVLVVENGTLDLSQWTGDDSYIRNVTISGENSRFISPNGAGKINTLAFTKGAGTASLNGGRYDEIAYVSDNTIKLGDLLAEGYAFRQNGTFLEYASKLESNDTVKKVEVVKCPHPDAKDGKCLYCGQTGILARVGDTTYDDVSKAVTDWLATGGTLKLYTDYTATDGTWSIGSGSHTINLNGHMMSVQNDGAFKPTNNMHLTVTDDTERGQITNILLDGSQRGSFTLENGYVCKLEMTGGAVVTLKGGRVDTLDVQNCSANTNISIQGSSLGKLNITDWADGMHVSATGGSLGAYTLPSGKILADVLDYQYYAEGTSLDKWVDTAQPTEEFVIKQAPHEFGSTSKAANVPINGRIPFMVDSPSGDATGYYDVMWYRRTNSGAEHMTQNRVADVNVNDKLDVFCVITGADSPGGEMKWQVAVKDYTIKVVPADLSQEAVVFKQVGESTTGLNLMGNIKDGKGTFVFAPWGGDVNNASTLTYCFEVSHDGQKLIEGKDYTIESGNTAQYAGDHTLTIEGKGNYTGTATHTWRIEPYKLTRGNYRPPTITKGYDGTTGFDFSKAGNWGIFTENVAHRPNGAGTGKNPSLGADGNAISIYLKPEDFKASAVTLDSPDAGDRTASFTIELKTRDGQREPNFAFEDGGSPTIQVTGAAASITKAPAPTGLANGALTVYNGTAKTYEIDIASLLPSPGAGCRYGEIYDSQTIGFKTYKTEITEIKLDSSYYDKTADKAKIEKGKLILPIRNVNTTTTGKIGTIKLNVISQNYHHIKDWTIDVSAANQPVSSSGGGGGKSDRPGTGKSETTTKPDGTTVKTETKSDGTVIETTTGKDGSVTKTETKKDGSSVTESKDAAGSTGTVKTDKNGQTTAETALSSKAIEDAKKNGEAVKAPVEVEASRDSSTAPVVKVELPKGTGDTKVEIPVSNVKPGTVAVLVHADGTEEIVKNSLPTEDGIQLTVNGGATVKIVDNSKDFADTRNHWAKDAIDFVSARGLVNGMNDSIYAPNNSTTRAQLWTILARQNNADLNGGNTWYEKAQLWSKNKGISDGTEPNGTIDRAQMVTMLWRAAGQPTAGGTANFTDVPADSYYANAVSWAVEGGITTGIGGGRFDPNSTCTRGQIATFLWRTMAE